MNENPVSEWVRSRRWNPFNSYKLLAHVHRWRCIKRGRPLPAPILITVDPTNRCNFNCVWCNAALVRKQRQGALSEKMLLDLIDFLPHWGEEAGYSENGTQAICIAGGGEPLLNPATAPFIDKARAKDIEIGVTTNGTRIGRYIDALSQTTWVGVSVDAGTSETYNKLKRLDSDRGFFERVIDNIADLADYAKRHNNKLGWKHPAYGVSYKYLLYRENIQEVYRASKLAKEIGCKNIHFRPASTTWDNVGTKAEICFSEEDIRAFQGQIKRAYALSDQNFGVYGVTHKFNSQFERSNCFEKCHAVFMTAVLMPSARKDAPKDAFALGLCCDRRGDGKLELLHDCADVSEIGRLWGGREHWKVHDRINVQQECPRCTYGPHNEIYEQVILNDSMTYKFI